MKRKNLLAAAATLGMVAASLAGISTPAALADNSGQPLTIATTADARVNGSSVNTNYGSLDTLSAAPSTWNTYLKFPTAAIDDGATITGAKLQFFIADSNPTPGSNLQVRPTTSGWSESTITWANQPSQNSTVLGTSTGGVGAGVVKTIDLPASSISKTAVTSFMVKGTTTGRIDMRSREHVYGANTSPRLILQYSQPETFLDDAYPSAGTTTSDTEASFWYRSDHTGATFECRLDGSAWASCPGNSDYTGLADGSHTFEARATSGGVTDASPVSHTWTVNTGSTPPPPPPSGSTPPPVDTGWTRIVDDRFDSGGLPAHWRTYDGPYGSGPGNCAEPDNNFVENGSLVLKMEYQTTGKCGAGWYTGGMQIEKAKGAIDQTMTVRMRVVYTDPVNVRSHRNVPMRWVDDPNFQWMEGESDYCEGSSTTGCTTFLHYDTTNQQVSKSHTFDVTQWQVFKVVHQNNRVQIILNGNTIWDYQGTTHTVPDAIRRAVLQQECRSSCPAASYAGQTERIEIDYVTIDNES